MIGRVSWTSHINGVRHKKEHFGRVVEMDEILNAPMIAWPLGLYDCCGVSDGSAAAIITTPEIAKKLRFDGKDPNRWVKRQFREHGVPFMRDRTASLEQFKMMMEARIYSPCESEANTSTSVARSVSGKRSGPSKNTLGY